MTSPTATLATMIAGPRSYYAPEAVKAAYDATLARIAALDASDLDALCWRSQAADNALVLLERWAGSAQPHTCTDRRAADAAVVTARAVSEAAASEYRAAFHRLPRRVAHDGTVVYG